MKILLASSEVAPFAKVGGLGDVSAALPRQLATLGHDVRIVMPFYKKVRTPERAFEEVVSERVIAMGPHRVSVTFLSSTLPGSTVPVYFVNCPALFDRPGVYGSGGDEHLRFALFQWAVLRLCQELRFSPDVLHVNDWQTGLLPVMLRSVFAWDQMFANTRTLLTIHNLGHQGTFSADVLSEIGLAPARDLLHHDHLRSGRFGYLETGILHANALTTVSPTYAREIRTPEHGVGLDGVLRGRSDVLFGILNGIDDVEWDPARDPHLAKPYSADNLAGKVACRAALLSMAQLPDRVGVPVFGIVSRLAWQKGFDLCVQVLPRLLVRRRFQVVVLGTGEPKLEAFFRDLARHFPTQVAYLPAFSERVAHQIEAGADVFLMPSRYEPCGLNQMYSLRYGTLPLVHKTGGLADTVWPVDLARSQGTGFVFDHFDAQGLTWAMERALEVYGTGQGSDRTRWQAIQQRGMRLPLGWSHRVGEYLKVYRGIAPHAA